MSACSDITLMYSVVDVAGLNSVSRRVLGNAAARDGGDGAKTRSPPTVEKPAVGMTMFGVTTPCVTMVREALEERGFDCLVFHATGAGGQAMEKLVEAGLITGVLDVTTTEVADLVVGRHPAMRAGRGSRRCSGEDSVCRSRSALSTW